MTHEDAINDDQCAWLAEQAQIRINTGFGWSLTPDMKEAWLIENTYSAVREDWSGL